MHFTADENETESKIWDLIIENLKPEIAKNVSAASSSFYRTADGLECAIREVNGSLIANVYSESDRMGNRRWSFDFTKENAN